MASTPAFPVFCGGTEIKPLLLSVQDNLFQYLNRHHTKASKFQVLPDAIGKEVLEWIFCPACGNDSVSGVKALIGMKKKNHWFF
jgi:hypothetical protein